MPAGPEYWCHIDFHTVALVYVLLMSWINIDIIISVKIVLFCSQADMSWPTVLAISAGLLGCYYLWKKKKYNFPPGPRQWPFIGIVLDILQGKMLGTLTRLGKEFPELCTVKVRRFSYGFTK